jgi:hypothetical protein
MPFLICDSPYILPISVQMRITGYVCLEHGEEKRAVL